MIVLENGIQTNRFLVFISMAKKERYFVKRFLIENEKQRRNLYFRTRKKSQLEIVSTDWRPVAEVIFAKVKGVQKENQVVDLEQFIAVKGIKALGNQLTTDKIKQINLLDPLPYEEVLDEPETTTNEASEEGNDIQDFNIELDDDGQITLSLE